MTSAEFDVFAEFAAPAAKPPADRIPTHDKNGCYDNLPSVPGFGVGPWPRVSDMDIFSDDKYLNLWKQRQVVRAIELNIRERQVDPSVEDLLKPMKGSRFDAATSYGKRKINGIVDACHEFIGSNKGSDLGTKFHEFAERLDGGESPKDFDLTPDLRKMLKAYWGIRNYFRIKPIPGYLERTVFIPELEACGTFDHLDTDGDVRLPVIGDTKTQSTMAFSHISIPQQLGSYAHAAYILDRVTWTWEPMPEVDQEMAVVLWCPADEPGRASVQDIDIVAGWEYALAARKVIADWRMNTDTIKQRVAR
jgi:hypothetical protein